MYKFIFSDEVEVFFKDLAKRAGRGDKDARIMFEKIRYIIDRVELAGTRAGKNFIKSLKGEENDNLYELRPHDERIFCCMWNGNHFVLLSHYTKDADETDQVELARARGLRDKWIKDHPVKDDKVAKISNRKKR